MVGEAPAIVVDPGGAVPLPHPALAVDGRRVRRGRPRAVRGHVLVADECGRADAMLLAEALTARGHRVTLATSCLHVGEAASRRCIRCSATPTLVVELRERVRVTAFEGATARLESQWDGRVTTVEDVDAILHWSGGTPQRVGR